MHMLIKCCLPFAIVEHAGFIEYHRKLDPSFKVPCRKTLSSLTINTSVDGWADETNRCFNGYIAQFIDHGWKLKTIPFAFEYVTGLYSFLKSDKHIVHRI